VVVLPVFLRHRGEEAVPALPGEIAGLDAETEVSRAKDGPFAPLPFALAEDAMVREAFARSLDLPLVEAYAKARLWLLLGLVPLLMLAELDRELARAGFEGAYGRLLGDVLVVGVAAVDLARKLPRSPRTTALLFFGGATRYVLFIARPCGVGVHPTIFLAPLVAIAAGLLLLRHAPTPAQVTRAILERLRIPEAAAEAVRARARPTRAHVGAALLGAVGMPLALAATRALGPWGQAALFVVYAAIVPHLVERRFEPRVRRKPAWMRVVPAAVAAFALTVGMTAGAHYGFDAAAYTTRCVSPSAFERTGKRALDAEGRDIGKNVEKARESIAYFLMTVLVVPLAEERVFRGLLQRVLARRFGNTRGIALAALAFGLAHLGVYKLAVYQTVLLGIGFGAAYAWGGYPAAVLTHAVWNLSLVL
jgi:membrane protease YdiL (CAAX protease family)